VRLPDPPLLVITDRHQARASLEDAAKALFAAGCRWLSLREKDLPWAERTALLRRLVTLGAAWNATVMIHDDLAAVIETGASGLHLPAGASVAAARRRLGAAVLIGQSAHDGDAILRAAGEGADYVTLSPIFITASKPSYGPALGLSFFAQRWPLPVLALGGIDETNIAACLESGAAGAAVMGGAMRAEDPGLFMAGLLARMGRRLAPNQGCTHS